MYGLGLDGYDPDSQHDAAVAFRIRVVAQEQYIPLHQHRKGQLIMALGGAITCEVENAMLMVPPQYAVWIPGQTPHSNKATPGAQLCLLFIEPGALELPTRTCTLKISPLVRELVLALADRSQEELPLPATGRLVDVLFDELPLQPQEHLQRNLARLVVKETGLSFRRWRHQLQLIVALQFLIGGKSVQQAAQALGYDSTTAFITMFKKGLGQTPARYIASLTTTSR